MDSNLPRSRKYDGKKLGWLNAFKALVRILLLLFIVFRFLIGFSFVSGDSMSPTLHNGEPVFYTRFTRNFKPGDVVSVHVPSDEYYVKRIIAVGGDTVDIRGGRVYINGALMYEEYASGLTLEEPGAVHYPYTLEDGQFFVMGDNRSESVDSRAFGAVSERQIKGKLWFVN